MSNHLNPAPPEQPQQTPAEQLGLHDGAFAVVRSDGSVDAGGWGVLGVNVIPDAQGEPVKYARIIGEDPTRGGAVTKDVRVDKLLSWQETPAELGGRSDAELDRLAARQVAKAVGSTVAAKVAPDALRLREFFDLLHSKEDSLMDRNPEEAAVRAPTLGDILRDSPLDDNKVHRVSAEKQPALERFLEQFGISNEAPTPETIQAGIDRARRVVESGNAAAELAKEPFLSQAAYKEFLWGLGSPKRELFRFDKELYIDPKRIEGAGGHDSWAGRGRDDWNELWPDASGQGSVRIREVGRPDGKSGYRSSIEQLSEYAVRDTQLPPLEGMALTLTLTTEEPVFFVGNGAHRTSAAKLRDEPLAFTSLVIIDAR